MKPVGIYKFFTHSAKNIPLAHTRIPTDHFSIVQSQIALEDLFAPPM